MPATIRSSLRRRLSQIERTVEFRLLERGTMQPDDPPGTHPGVYREAAAAGVFGESMAADLADLWRDHRAKTYYQDGLASAGACRRDVRTRH